MSLQYLEALKQIGSSASTKFVVPMEFSNLLSSVIGGTARSFSNGGPNAGAELAPGVTPEGSAQEPAGS